MIVKRVACRQGVTLIEALISTVLFMAVALGAAVFGYNAASETRNADLLIDSAFRLITYTEN